MSSTSTLLAGSAVQGTFDELGPTLADTTFVVVDLETTGGSPATSAITEIGAVKVRGGVELGEFQTLVNPHAHIPAFISVLTGITDAMVAEAPAIGQVLPSFLEFARGSVLVAHNARFDVGFLRAAAERSGLDWPAFRVLDTVHLARQLVPRDEAPNHKLATLAALFSSRTTPDHRALHDAKATVDVLHELVGRVGNQGVHTLDELLTFTSRVSPAQRRKRHLAEGLPSRPGVYVFKDAQGRPLYVGTSQDIRSRVRSYFTASERRTRMAEMVAIAESVTPIVCGTRLEAQVRELRLIASHQPRYNRRSRHPDRGVCRGRGRRGPRRGPAAPVHPAAEPAPPQHGVRPGRDGALRRPLHRRPVGRRLCRGGRSRPRHARGRLPRGRGRAPRPHGLPVRRGPLRGGGGRP